MRAATVIKGLEQGMRSSCLSMSRTEIQKMAGVSEVLPNSMSLSVQANYAYIRNKYQYIQLEGQQLKILRQVQYLRRAIPVERQQGCLFQNCTLSPVIILLIILQMEESSNAQPPPVSQNILQTANHLANPLIQNQSSLVEMNIEDTVSAATKAEPSPKQLQKKITIALPEDNRQNSELTKRSDESEFVNWKISTIRSGKFFFEENKPPQKEQATKINQHLQVRPAPPPQKQEKRTEINRQSPNAMQQQPLKIKVPKTLSNTKKQLIKYFTDQFGAALRKSKAVKILFSHFCKENNLTSIKSTLFENKPKVMEEMSLNKWMVFCKQFDILEKLYQTKQQHSSETKNKKEQIRVKQLKRAEGTLVNIFKSINQNLSKIDFQGFVSGLLLIFDQLKSLYSYDEEGAKGFVEQILHCSTQKQCLKKLSGLKFTASTPKITYSKRCINPAEAGTIERSRFSRHNQKENMAEKTSKNDKLSTSPLKKRQRQKFKVNTVISQAKLTLVRNEAPKYSNQHQKTKTKLVLQEIRQNKKERTNSQKQLYRYFQSTKDPILDSYFVMEERKLQASKNINS